MVDLNSMIRDNEKERERLIKLMARLKETELRKRLPNGWSVSVALAHLAFWDFYQVNTLQRWIMEGRKPDSTDSLIVNDSLSLLSEAIPSPTVVKFTQAAAEMADKLVEKLTQAQADEFLKVGSERLLHRALHRRMHLDKIEQALQAK